MQLPSVMVSNFHGLHCTPESSEFSEYQLKNGAAQHHRDVGQHSAMFFPGVIISVNDVHCWSVRSTSTRALSFEQLSVVE